MGKIDRASCASRTRGELDSAVSMGLSYSMPGTHHDALGRALHPTADDRRALRDFWDAYDPCRAEVSAELNATAREIPVFAAIIAGMTAEQQAMNEQRSRELQRAAILEGAWDAYVQDLHIQGSVYAQMGVPYGAWFGLLTTFRRAVLSRLTLSSSEDRARFVSAVTGMDMFIDIAMSGIGESYLHRKEALIRAGEARYTAMVEHIEVSLWEADLTAACAALEALRAAAVPDVTLHLEEHPEELARLVASIEVREVNPAAVRLCGATGPEQLRGSFAGVCADESMPGLRALFGALGRGERTARVEGVLATLGGGQVDVLVTLRLLRADDGRELGLFGMQDISHLRRVERELARSNAELEQFAYVASHDLQEPLRKLIAFSGLLQKDVGPELPAPAVKDLEFITDAAQRMQTLIQDLLALSRVSKQRVMRNAVELDTCLDRALNALSLRIEERSAVIERQPLPRVQGDPILLAQLFQNLIANALKFSGPEAPRISITVEPHPKQLTVAVRDNGIGIDPRYQDQIFQPFRRLHTRAKYPGSGIGLAICRKAAELHGGRIWVESAGEGHGSTFKFTLSKDSPS